MSTEREKLIEIWLDSASEREYQFAFRSALLFSGYKVLHNTGHTSLELGKDVIAIAPNGDVVAYQLKGNPSGRITISQWQALIPQINTLIYQPVGHPNIAPATLHHPFLVTNGEIHEDVAAAIVAYNRKIESSSPPANALRTMARGELLNLFFQHADKIWPVDIAAQREILNLIAAASDDVVPDDLYCALIYRLLGLNEGKAKFKIERVAAAHLVTSIVVSNWQKKNNLVEVIRLYTLLYAGVCSYIDRSGGRSSPARKYLSEIEFNIRETLSEFVEYMKRDYDGRPLINSNMLQEFSYFHARKKMVIGLAATAAMDTGAERSDEIRDFLWRFVCASKSKAFLIGEFMVPFCLATFWAQSELQGTNKPDREIIGILQSILNQNSSDEARNHVPGPYYGLADVVKRNYQEFLGVGASQIDDESHHHRSWFAEALFYLVVRRNYKQTCQYVWSDLTKFLHTRTRLKEPWQFGMTSCDEAKHEDKQIKIPQTWSDVVVTASQSREPKVPAPMLDKPFLVLLYCLFVPYRMDFDVIMWLDRKLSRSAWY